MMTETQALSADKPLSIAILAMGGQGGGVLADWIVHLAESQGWVAQTTSVPGVAQRTGATIYYLEMIPARDGVAPILSLMPTPGDVDVVIAAELMEAGKHNWLFKRYFEERGYVEKAPFEVRERAIEESFRQLQQRERELQAWEERLKAEANAQGSTTQDTTATSATTSDATPLPTPQPTGNEEQDQ